VSLPNTRIVIVGVPSAEAQITAYEVSHREAHRAAEVLEREEARLSAKMRRELQQLRADLRKVR